MLDALQKIFERVYHKSEQLSKSIPEKPKAKIINQISKEEKQKLQIDKINKYKKYLYILLYVLLILIFIFLAICLI